MKWLLTRSLWPMIPSLCLALIGYFGAAGVPINFENMCYVGIAFIGVSLGAVLVGGGLNDV